MKFKVEPQSSPLVLIAIRRKFAKLKRRQIHPLTGPDRWLSFKGTNHVDQGLNEKLLFLLVDRSRKSFGGKGKRVIFLKFHVKAIVQKTNLKALYYFYALSSNNKN